MRPVGCGACVAVLLLFPGCMDPQPGLAPTPPGGGPQIVFDLDERPLPEIPFPSDLATRPDSSSPTGLRVNASLIASSDVESKFRSRLDNLTGFSTFAPISVRFTAGLDLDNIIRRHGPDGDMSDDAVFLVNLKDGSLVPLDVGGGAYPYVLERPDRYFPDDPRAEGSNLVFETVEEDLNGNGILDSGEDSDWDGVLDHPNTIVVDGDPVDDLMTFYERETNTLILRPLVPLEQETGYAVVLTNRLTDSQAEPVRSPFAYINHARQNEALAPLLDYLDDIGGGLSLSDLAFCWSFTTQSTTRDLEDLRMGLYGSGPFAWLADEFGQDTLLENAYDDPGSAPVNPFVVPAKDILEALEPIGGAMLGNPDVVAALIDSFDYVDYLVLGRARTPLLLHGVDGIFELNAKSGQADVSEDTLPWLLAIPKERPEQGITAPFPVAIYLHGTGGDRMQVLGFAGQLAKFGIATVGVDLVMHGMVLPEDWHDIFDITLQAHGFGPVARALLDNRTIDVNNDGVNDPSGNFWTYDAFRSRDAVRQGALDVMRLVQIFSAFDGRRTWSFDADGDGKPDLKGLAGDFDGDGRVDLVGPDGPYFLFGISLGGIVTSVAAACEPKITAAVPISSGGGMIDIVLRSLQTGVPEMAMLPFMGPLLIGARDPQSSEAVLAFYVNDARFEKSVPVHSLAGLRPGDKIRLVNLDSGEEEWSVAGEDLAFRAGLPCDKGDALRMEAVDASGKITLSADTFDRDVSWQGEIFPAGSPLVSLSDGLGVRRQSPEMRRFIQIAQTALDAGDPVNYAPHYWLRPTYSGYPGVGRSTRVSVVVSVGDMNVPISTGVAQARAAGLIPMGSDDIDPRFGKTPHRVLTDNWVIEGLERLKRFDRPPWNDERAILLDPDFLSEGNDGNNAPTLAEPLRLSVALPDGGVGALRFLYVKPRGAHGFGPSDPSKIFNIDLYAINAIGHYFATGGAEWIDDTCLADDSCSFIPTLPGR